MGGLILVAIPRIKETLHDMTNKINIVKKDIQQLGWELKDVNFPEVFVKQVLGLKVDNKSDFSKSFEIPFFTNFYLIKQGKMKISNDFDTFRLLVTFNLKTGPGIRQIQEGKVEATGNHRP